MSDSAGELIVEVNGRDIGLSAFLDRLEAQLVKAEQSGQKAGQGIGDGLGSGAQRASASVASLTQAEARLEAQQAQLARAQGDGARAAQLEASAQDRISAALVRTDVTTKEAIALQRQLVQVQQQVAKANQEGSSYAQQFGSSLKSSLLGMVGPAAAATAAIGALKGSVDLAQMGAAAADARASFDSLASSAGLSGEKLLSSIKAASGGTVSESQIIQSSNTAILLAGSKMANELPKLLQVARASAKATGQDVGFVFDSLVRGIARGSPQIIDNAGITLNASAAFETYARSIGKSADELTKEEQQIATLNAVTKAGDDIIKKVGIDNDSAQASFQRLGAEVENTKTRVGELFAALAKNPVNNLTKALAAPEQRKQAGGDALANAKDWQSYQVAVKVANAELVKTMGTYHGMKPAVDSLTEAQFKYAQSLIQSGVGASDALTRARALGPALDFLSKSADTGGAAMQRLNQSALQVAATIPGGEDAVANLAIAYHAGGLSAEQFQAALTLLITRHQAGAAATQQSTTTAAQFTTQLQQQIGVTQQSADKSLLDSSAKQTQAAQTQLLQQQTITAANAFLALNPNIDAAGVASLVAAGKISSSVGQYIAMTLATANARAELARLQALAGVSGGAGGQVRQSGGGGSARVRTENGRSYLDDTRGQARALAEDNRGTASAEDINAATAKMKAQTKAEQDLKTARDNQILSTGTAAQKQALYNARLDEAARLYGKNSAEYVNAQTALRSFDQQQEKSSAKHKKAGAEKLSDQQKLNNSLLADQEKYNDEYDDAELKHAQARLKIITDFQEKMKDAQAKFDQDNLDSRASFYDQLGSVENAKIRKAASVAYEQAAQEAGKIAQEKGADVADKYMAAQEQVISARAKRQAEIEKATNGDKGGKGKDKDQAAYLAGVDKLYRQAEDRKLAAIANGEDSLAQQRDKALKDEDRAYEEQQGKIADSADRAAERKVAAAERAGKKIDEEQLKVDKLAASYDKVAPARGEASGGSTGAASAPASSAAASAPASSGGGSDGADLASLIDAITSKLDEVKRGIVEAEQRSATVVAGAVRSLAGKVA